MREYILINEKYHFAKKASLPVSENGFLFGDGLFESLRGYKGNIFAFGMHLQRLFSSMNKLRFNMDFFSKNDIVSATQDLLAKNKLLKCDSYIKIIVARSSYIKKLIYDPQSKPTLIIIAKKLLPYPENYYKNGIDIFTASNKRSGADNDIYRYKLLNYFENIFAKNEAAANNAQEAFFVTGDNVVLEGATSNIFIVKNNMVFTTPLTQNILPGITRQIVMDICQKNRIKLSEKRFHNFNLFEADEIFLTNSIMEIMPVKRVDNHKIGQGIVPGKTTLKIHSLYKPLTVKEYFR
jgi:branched-chain amino acid aminotransferase